VYVCLLEREQGGKGVGTWHSTRRPSPGQTLGRRRRHRRRQSRPLREEDTVITRLTAQVCEGPREGRDEPESCPTSSGDCRVTDTGPATDEGPATGAVSSKSRPVKVEVRKWSTEDE
jgi:hypothetical protein